MGLEHQGQRHAEREGLRRGETMRMQATVAGGRRVPVVSEDRAVFVEREVAEGEHGPSAAA